jgi:hypothetical protein
MLRLLVAGIEGNLDKIKELLAKETNVNAVFTDEEIEKSGVKLKDTCATLPKRTGVMTLTYRCLANRSLLGLYFNYIVSSWATGAFTFPVKIKLNNHELSQHLDFVVALVERGARPQAKELSHDVLDFIALYLVTKNRGAKEGSQEASILISCQRLLETFAKHYDQLGFEKNEAFTVDDLLYLAMMMQQNQLPSNRKPFCDVALKYFLRSATYMHIGYEAFRLIQEKTDTDRADAMMYLSRMYQAGKGKCSLENLKNWDRKVLAVLESFTPEGQTTRGWDVTFNNESYVTWYDFFLWRSEALVTELIRLREFNEAKAHLRAWIHFLGNDFLKCRPDDSETIPLLFSLWGAIASSDLENRFVSSAMNAFQYRRPQAQQIHAHAFPPMPVGDGAGPNNIQIILEMPGELGGQLVGVLHPAGEQQAPGEGEGEGEAEVEAQAPQDPAPAQAPFPFPFAAPVQAPNPQQEAQARERALQNAESELVKQFYLLHSDVVNKTNWNNASLLAKPLLSLMTLMAAVSQGTEKRLVLNSLWKRHFTQPGNFDLFQMRRQELETVVRELDKLFAFIPGTTNFFVGIAERFVKHEKIMTSQQTQIAELQKELTQVKGKLSALGTFPPADSAPSDLPKGQQKLDKWFVKK